MRGENPHAGALRYISPRTLACSDHVNSLVSRFEGLFYASSVVSGGSMATFGVHDPLRLKSVGALVNAGHFAGAGIGPKSDCHRAKKKEGECCDMTDGKI